MEHGSMGPCQEGRGPAPRGVKTHSERPKKRAISLAAMRPVPTSLNHIRSVAFNISTLLEMERRTESSCFPRKVMQVAGCSSLLGLIINPALWSASATLCPALRASQGRRAVITMSSR